VATTILRYEPRFGPPRWVLCMDGRVVSVREGLDGIEDDIEAYQNRGPDQDVSGA
jgi:hypothetical protein